MSNPHNYSTFKSFALMMKMLRKRLKRLRRARMQLTTKRFWEKATKIKCLLQKGEILSRKFTPVTKMIRKGPSQRL